MNQNPLTILLITGLTAYLAKSWWNDYKLNRIGRPNTRTLPGARPTTFNIVIIAIAGSLLILAVETSGEIILGIAHEQSTVSWLFLLGMISAGFYEELLFRGFFVIKDKGGKVLIASIVGFSALFALIHFHWIDWTGMKNGWFVLNLQVGPCFWTVILFINSLWFYTVRFFALNKTQSLIPCIVAHVISNVGVFIIKLAQGHVSGVY